MWNSFNTAGPVGIVTEMATYKAGNGDEIHAYVARPTSGESRGGVVALHHNPGFDEFYLEFAERIARHGYDVILPDLFCRFGHGNSQDISAKVRAEGGCPDDTAVLDIVAAAAWLRELPTNNGKVGIIGGCSGGRQAVLAASQSDAFDAVVDLWGGQVVMAPDLLSPQRPVAPIDLTESLHGPLLGLFGVDDQRPSPKEVAEHEEALKAAGKTYEFTNYEGAGHSFMCYHQPVYRQAQAMDAWNKVFTFFETYL